MSAPLSVDVIERLAAHVDRDALERMRVVTGRPGNWIPVALRTGAVTIGRHVFFRAGRFDTGSGRGLALIAHEAMHVGQYGELGLPGFFARYAWGIVTSRFRYARHPMEAPLIAAQRRIRVALEREQARSV